MVSSIHEIAISCPAKIARAPHQNKTAIVSRTLEPYRNCRNSGRVVNPCSFAKAQMRGPTNCDNRKHPMEADPTHHHAPIPNRYPSPAAPTVDPAPMFAARNVAKILPGPSLRPATRKSDEVLTRLLIHSPTLIRNSE